VVRHAADGAAMTATQLTLTGVEAQKPIGDDLDRCYSPEALADAIVRQLKRHIPPPATVVEPSVGGGAFVRAVRRHWLGTRVIGVDIDPTAAGLRLCDESAVTDWPGVASAFAGRDVLVLGNPPFGEAIAHVEAALSVARRTVLLLPWAYWGVAAWAHLLREPARPWVVSPILGRPWPDRVRETAVYEWVLGGRNGPPTVVMPLVGWP
jgi:hypothetical protein